MGTVFDLSFLLIAPFWLLMIFAPRWHVTRRLVASPLIAVGPALVYAVVLLPVIGLVLPLVAQPTLPEIAALLGTPRGATLGWLHFLAFDLLIARLIYLDLEPRGVSALILAPLFVLTLLLGPVGYLVYLVLRMRQTPDAQRRTPEAA